MDWQIGSRPPLVSGVFDVWMSDGSIREVIAHDSILGALFMFYDCTHAAQNAFCPPTKIMGWRLKEKPSVEG